MRQISINEQSDLDEIIYDTSLGGKYIRFYEMLQDSLRQYTETRIEDIKTTLRWVLENEPENYKSDKKIEDLTKMDVLYLYSQLN